MRGGVFLRQQPMVFFDVTLHNSVACFHIPFIPSADTIRDMLVTMTYPRKSNDFMAPISYYDSYKWFVRWLLENYLMLTLMSIQPVPIVSTGTLVKTTAWIVWSTSISAMGMFSGMFIMFRWWSMLLISWIAYLQEKANCLKYYMLT